MFSCQSTHKLSITKLNYREAMKLSRIVRKQLSTSESSPSSLWVIKLEFIQLHLTSKIREGSDSTVNVGAIVGPVIVGVLAIVLILLHIYSRYRRSRPGRKKEVYHSSIATSIFLPSQFRRNNSAQDYDRSSSIFDSPHYPREDKSSSYISMDSRTANPFDSSYNQVHKKSPEPDVSRVNILDMKTFSLPSVPKKSVHASSRISSWVQEQRTNSYRFGSEPDLPP